ncbi:MAG TPA: Xaa-Pro peptidase family protein [Vicinamibacteria bacterium]|nr:Xaa-Pro peptidase family protein [Vicinamibacteria bacterium]
MQLAAIQKALEEQGLDGWLLYDFRGSNPIARSVIGFDASQIGTRRWFYLVPRAGEPVAILHVIEPHATKGAPGRTVLYRSWRELEDLLRRHLEGLKRVAMEYSPGAAIPYVARVDAGTIEMVRAAGPEVVSSADLVQIFEARWTPEQKALHDEAAIGCHKAKDRGFGLIRERLAASRRVTESEVQALIQRSFEEEGLYTHHPCIVAVNDHASDPHFETAAGPNDREIKKGDLVLIDFWAKVANDPRAVYYDATWMGYCGQDVPAKMREVWETVKGARDAAVDFVKTSAAQGRTIHGYEVDDVSRKHIEDRGYGPYFLHRTGHSIGYEVHGNGVNIDNLETRDQRKIIPGVCFSIEPGVYLPEFGVRSEIDMYVGEGRAEVTGDIQRELLLLA